MSWAIFRSNYRKAIKNNEKDMASVIADSYGICTKAGTSIPGGPVLQGNVEGLKSQLKTSFNSLGAYPMSTALDTGLKLFWLGSSTVTGFICTNPGFTSLYIPKKAQESKDLDDFVNYMISCFETFHKQLVFTNPAGAPSFGYEIILKEKDSDGGGEVDAAEKVRGTNPEDETDDKDF